MDSLICLHFYDDLNRVDWCAVHLFDANLFKSYLPSDSSRRYIFRINQYHTIETYTMSHATNTMFAILNVQFRGPRESFRVLGTVWTPGLPFALTMLH